MASFREGFGTKVIDIDNGDKMRDRGIWAQIRERERDPRPNEGQRE